MSRKPHHNLFISNVDSVLERTPTAIFLIKNSNKALFFYFNFRLMHVTFWTQALRTWILSSLSILFFDGGLKIMCIYS